MADAKISALPGATTPLTGSEEIPLVQNNATKKVTISNVTVGRDMAARNITGVNAGDVTIGSNNTISTGSSVLQTKNDVNNVSQLMFYGSAQPAYGALGSGESAWYSSAAGMTIMCDNPSGVIKFAAGGNSAQWQLSSAGNFTQGTAAKGVNFTSNTPAVGMTSQLLNWYEEGTWTPNQGAGLTVVGAFSSNGTYVRIGRSVTVKGQVLGATTVAVAAAGVISSNLPFTAASGHAGSMYNAAITVGGTVAIISTSATAASAVTATPSITFTATYQI